MGLTVVTHIHNEAVWLPYFAKHYLPLADRIVVLDDGSTDNSASVAAEVMPDAEIVRRESDEWDAEGVDRACRAIERTAETGWVVSLPVDEFLGLSAGSLRSAFLSAEEAGYDYIRCQGYCLVQRPEDIFIRRRPLLGQFHYGFRDRMRDRYIHRNQHNRGWEYIAGRHFLPDRGLYDDYMPLYDYRFAPKELAFERRMIDSSRVGPSDLAKGFGIEKVNLTREKFEADYQEALRKAERLW